MANLENIINKKTADDTQWREERMAERENAVAMRDAGIMEITSDPKLYARFLQMQGDNPLYSAGNLAIVMLEKPDAGTIGTKDRWKQLGRTVLAGEQNSGTKIFTPATFPVKGYTLTDAYDVNQTQGKDLKRIQLQNDTPQMETALTKLLNYSVVPVVTDGSLDTPAYYDSEQMELYINPACADSEAFPAIAAEIAQSRFHGKGSNRYYDYEESKLDAESVSYILCRRFGVKCDLPELAQVAELYEGWEIGERTGALNSIHNMAKEIGGSIERGISPQQRGRVPEKRPAR